MATIITREIGATAKGSPLTNAELDQNFINLNTNNVELTDIGTGPNEVPLNQFLGELAYMDAQNIPSVGIARADIAVANAATANVTNLLQVTEISNAVPTLNLDFAKVKQLDPRITFSRASTATYYDGKTLAKAEENLFTFSQDFNNAAWVKTNAIISENTGDTTAPDGTATAEKLTVTGGSNAHALSQSLFMAVSTYTVSVFAKKGTQLYFKLGRNTGTAIPTPGTWWWNLDAGTFNGTLGAGWTNQSITSVGNGWYRCVVSVTTTATGTDGFSVALTDNAGNNIFSADTNTFYAWGAQLEQRASATAYTPTATQPVTNYIPVLQTAAAGVPRFDHNPVTGESLGLEIEEQRANLLTYSEQFDNAAWTKARATIIANVAVAPNGIATANKLVEDTTASNTHFIRSDTAVTSGLRYTYSFFASAAGRSEIVLSFGTDNSSFSDTQARFALTGNGTATTVAGTPTATITAIGGGWYRCTATATATASATGVVRLSLAVGGANVYTGNGYSGVFIWGAQMEEGAFATSYIPTVVSQVTRAADAASMTGVNFSSWYSQREGTFYAEVVYNGHLTGAVVETNTIVIDDGTAVNRFNIRTVRDPNTPQADIAVASGGITQMDSAGLIPAIVGTTYKRTIAYAPNNAIPCVNGVLDGVTDTSFVVPVGVNRLALLQTNCALYLRRITYYPQRLSNLELVEMTA